MPSIAPNWPFSPRKSPIFYGWVIWVFSTLGVICSIPGQTMGLAVFTDAFIDVLGLSRTELSMAYLAGTVGSSLFLTAAGRWYDRLGGRLMITLASLALGLMVFFVSMTDHLAALLGGGSVITLGLIMVGYFGVRFFGQGMLTSCSRNVLLLWFVRRRGLVSGVRGVFISIGFSLAPLLLGWMILTFGWREALWIMAFSVGVVFAGLALVFIRDNPASCGLRADGGLQGDSDTQTVVDVPSQSLRQARRSPLFWIYSGSLGMHAMFGTALTFHIVSVFTEAGRDSSEAFGYFLPAAVFSTAVNLLGSAMVDRHRLKPYLVLMLICFIGGAVGLLNLADDWGFWLLAAGFGAGGGLWGVISNLAFIRFFGPLHLGEISGLNTALTVFASAIGPAAFSLGLDHFGSYNAAVKICLFLLVLLLMAALWVRQEEVVHA
jgi:OFA family oxalate/formate antiporter-like MFS transporter